MGSVANKIAKKILSARGSKVVDLTSWQEGKQLATEAGFVPGAGPVPDKFADLHPCHGFYVITQNVVSFLSESISTIKEAKSYVRIVGDAQDEYMPSGPPMSPLTVSYFTMWAFFDVQFGSSRETIGTCILRLAPEFDMPSWLTNTVKLMQHSRMGFFMHCGKNGEEVLLREIGTTQEVVSCLVSSGYTGSEGEIWFVRVLPPPDPLCTMHIVMNTPYVIRHYPEKAFSDYLARELGRMKAQKKPPLTDDLHRYLMKHGRDYNHWNEYIFCAYTGHEYDVIYLTGIPDIFESLPHSRRRR